MKRTSAALNRPSKLSGSCTLTPFSPDYTPISLNQYVTITRENPLLRLIQGTHSGQNLTVTLLNGSNSQALTVAQVVAGQPAFVAEAAVDVSTGAQWRKLRVQSTTSTTPAITATREGWMFFPPQDEMLTYDNDGNLYSDARWTYVWDAENRLKSMEEKVIAGEGPARTRLEFTYDSQHRRVRKVVKSFSSTTNSFVLTKDRRFIYDGWNLVAELDASPLLPGGPATSQEILRSYLWGNDLSGTPQGAGGVGGLLMIQERDLRAKRGGLTAQAPAVYVPIYDFNGNVINYVEINRGEGITHTFDYDAFGRELTQDTLIPSGDTSPPESLPIKFSTKYHDEETGLAYYGYRHYSAEMGRWVNRDPIGERGGLNLYGMVGNDAVNRWDVLGLKITPWSGGPPRPSFTNGPIVGGEMGSYGVTNYEFPDVVATVGHFTKGCERWHVSIQGRLEIGIQIWEARANTLDQLGNTVLEHENTHANNLIEAWNQLGGYIDKFERDYASEECADLAAKAANKIAEMLFQNFLMKDAEFHTRAIIDSRADIDAANKASRDFDRLDREVRRLEQEYQRKCIK